MNFALIIPVHNEEAFLSKMLDSIVNQTLIPTQVIIVNDVSTDGTQTIIDTFSKKHPFISSIELTQNKAHEPGSKVIKAFYEGYKLVTSNPEFIGKFDGDIVLPPTYFESIFKLFRNEKKVGIAGGNLYIQKSEKWVFENISSKKKVRGPIKIYRKACFEQIGGLKKSIGWDTVDELLAQYHGWEIKTDETLHVKHLKPTGATYTKASRFKQGEAFKKMRYGFFLTLIASAKLALKKKSFPFFFNTIIGFYKAENNYIVSEAEGKFIRNLRWRDIKKKLF